MGEQKMKRCISLAIFLGIALGFAPFAHAQTFQQGDTLFIKIQSAKRPASTFAKRQIGFFQPDPNAKTWVGIVGIDAREKPGTYFVMGKKIKIAAAKFKTTELEITPEQKSQGFTAKKIVKGDMSENAVLARAMVHSPAIAYFTNAFAYPLDSIKDVGAFGNIRKSGKTRVQHLGVDLEAALGTPVHASNEGVIKFAKELPTYGKTLVIDHGIGIYTLYLHLNEFKVAEGQRVSQGDIVGLSGSTGYSLEPHVHFSVKVGRASVDPLKFVEASKAVDSGK